MKPGADHHPETELLESFVRRELPPGVSVIASAHLEVCDLCRQKAAEIEARELDRWLTGKPAPQQFPNLKEIAAGIVNGPRAEMDRNPDSAPDAAALDSGAGRQSNSLGLPKDTFPGLRLPRALRRAGDGLQWRKLTETIRQASFAIDQQTRCEFIYLAPGAISPAHSHYGREYTLVLQGEFHDGLGAYRDGDFLLRDASHEHQPRSEKGCLVFAVLDQPLRFTEGLPRLLNPVNRLRFRWGLARK